MNKPKQTSPRSSRLAHNSTSSDQSAADLSISLPKKSITFPKPHSPRTSNLMKLKEQVKQKQQLFTVKKPVP